MSWIPPQEYNDHMKKNSFLAIVAGGLNTDIFAQGANKLLSAGEHTYAKKLMIGPGGKSRNIAQMIATLIGKNKVAMIGKTSKDPYGLWRVPIDALKNSGVNTNNIMLENFSNTGEYPGIALIPVDNKGQNQIYVLPGITNQFSPKDIDKANDAFNRVKQNNGCLVVTLEMPLETVSNAIKKANDVGINVLFDPGGIEENIDHTRLFKHKIYLIKPNEHEIKILTGKVINDFISAKKAADILLNKNVEYVLITHGKHGGYFFSKSMQVHLPIPNIKLVGTKDETGCGDQTMAALSAALTDGKDILTAVKIGVLAGTLQFYKQGIIPVKKEELEKYKNLLTS
jgi:ribokinase